MTNPAISSQRNQCRNPAKSPARNGGAERAGQATESAPKGAKRRAEKAGVGTEVTQLAHLQLYDWKVRIDEFDPGSCIDSIEELLTLVAAHPGLAKEVAAMRQLVSAYNELDRLVAQSPMAITDRKAAPDFDKEHEEAIRCLWNNFLCDLWYWEPGKYAEPLGAFGDELLAIMELVQYCPSLQREVVLMRRISEAVDVLILSVFLNVEPD